MLRERPAADTQPLLSAEPSYNLHDIMVKITNLPSAGVVLKADSLTPVVLGDTLTAAELAALTFAPTSLRSQETPRGNGLVIYVPQDCGRLPIPLFADLAAGIAADTLLVITELPSNGSVFLANGMTAVVRGQAITAAQLCGLTFRPAADAVGRISLLRYRGSEEALTGEVLLVVGPAVPSLGARETAARGDNSSVSPIAVALLLEAGLSSLNARQASAAASSNDLLPPDSSPPSGVMAGMAHQISGRATGFLPDHVIPDHIMVPASATLTQLAAGTDTTGTDAPLPRHHIGSSSPPDFGSLKLVPLSQSTTLTSTSLPGSFDIANNAVLEIKGPSAKTVTFDTGNGELILDRSAQFHGLIGSSSPSTPLSPNDLIDLKDLPFTSSMSATVHYDGAANISTVDFGNGAKTVTLQFSGQDLNWIFKSDGQGGTIVADPPTTNPIVLENQKQGTPQSVWWVDPGQDSTKLQGFTTAMSTNIGGTVQFKIDDLTGNPNYQIQIYRLGYYGGDGARLITTLQHTTSVTQPAPITNPATGEVDAGNWSVTDSWNIPSSTVSGVYIANVLQGDPNNPTQIFQIPFVVKDTNSTSNIVFQTADETWQAYNGWGGANLYGGDGPSNPPPEPGAEPTVGAAFAVSYNRPIVTRDSIGTFAGPQDSLFGAEYSAIYWLEENGYDVSYISGLDTSTNGALLLNHKVFMDAGHDEYWTDSQVANVQAAENAGVNLVFLSGNEMFWQTQFQTSIDGSNTANRTLVTYKDSHFEQLMNPDGQGTGAFEAPISWGGANMPSNAITGTLFSVDQTPTLGTITIPYNQTQLRFWRNTSIANTPTGQTASLENGLLGYEWDSSPNNGFMPAGLIDLSSTTLQEPTVNLQFGNVDLTGTATHNLVEYRDPTSGALVFGAGTVFWSWGLSDQHDGGPDGNQTNTDPNVQQAMVNLFADMGVQPQTLQASLMIASQSTDHTPPTSKITSVSSTSPVEGQTVTVTGTATDVGGVVGAVQISTDGGKTWNVTSGQIGTQAVNWTYTFNTPAPGTYTIETRAVDDSLNLETPSDGTAYTVTSSSAISLFSSSGTPAVLDVADNSVEVGVKFTSATNGVITAIRFYKGPTNTGTHVGDLWSSTGTLLASATFSNETASGWQQVNLSTPVKVTAGTTYVVSYHTNGNYADTAYYFDNYTGTTNGSLTAAGDATNGVWAYGGGSVFPSNPAPSQDNYWVDVVFNDTSQGPQANDASGFVTTENSALSFPASALLANDTDPKGLPLSLSGVSNPSNGTVIYNASTQTITFTPNAGYTGPASFTYTITDGQASASGNVSLTVNYPVSAQSLFNNGDTPATVTVNDPQSLELGVKFQASTTGTITGIRFYKGPQNSGTHVADLWSAAGTLLATATFTNETASGWQQVNLSSPVVVTAGTTYVVSYHTSGDYSVSGNYFATAHTNGSLTAPASGTSGGDGVYAYGTGSIFPTNSFNASNYWVDVVYNGSPIQANNDGGFVATTNTTLSIPASAVLANDTDASGLPLSITGVSNPSNGTVSYNSSTQTISFVPAGNYTGPAGFTYSISDGQGQTASANVSLSVNDASLFNHSTTPSIVTENDPNSVELGFKFQAATSGSILGVEFYKGPQNTGTHVADLWTATGTLLATATFTTETASGWQQVDFSNPVAITAGTTYVASYHTNGNYSADPNLFAAAQTNGPLTAPSSSSSGGNGVYAYGSSSLFPTNSFNSTSYGVDVLFRPQLVA
jgi:Domain of unknown function (DUF4082)/Bacterial Ig domain/Cadherin-like domain